MHSVTYLLSELPYVGCKSLNLIPNLPSSVCTGSYLNLRRLSAVLYIPCYLFLLLLNPINWLILSDEIFVPITICFWDETKALLVVFKLYKNVSLSDFFLKVWGNFEHRIWICWSLWKQFKQRSPFLREKKKEINFRFSLSNLFFFKSLRAFEALTWLFSLPLALTQPCLTQAQVRKSAPSRARSPGGRTLP